VNTLGSATLQLAAKGLGQRVNCLLRQGERTGLTERQDEEQILAVVAVVVQNRFVRNRKRESF